MKLLAIWFCGNRIMAKGALEDRLAHLSICWRRTQGHQRLLASSEGQQGWLEKKPWGSTEVNLVVVIEYVCVCVHARMQARMHV